MTVWVCALYIWSPETVGGGLPCWPQNLTPNLIWFVRFPVGPMTTSHGRILAQWHSSVGIVKMFEVTPCSCTTLQQHQQPGHVLWAHHNPLTLFGDWLLYRTCDVSLHSRNLIIYSPSFRLSFISWGIWWGFYHPFHQVFLYFITIGALFHQQVIGDFFITIPNTWFVVTLKKRKKNHPKSSLVFCVCFLQNIHSCSDFPEQASDSSCLLSYYKIRFSLFLGRKLFYYLFPKKLNVILFNLQRKKLHPVYIIVLS